MPKNVTLTKAFPYIIMLAALIGLIASFVLSFDTLSIAKNPNYIPACNLNPVISCGNVINAKGDTIFGLPYPYYGIAAFAALLTAGINIIAGYKPSKLYMRVFLSFSSLGLLSAYALLIKSIFTIHSLCPFCLSVDVVTTIIFWYSFIYSFRNRVFKVRSVKIEQILFWASKHHADIIIFWFLLVCAFILNHFWYYYGKHL